MITKAQAADMGNTEFHYVVSATTCKTYKRNGVTQVKPRTPEFFKLPVVDTQRYHDYIDNSSADEFHLADDCPGKK